MRRIACFDTQAILSNCFNKQRVPSDCAIISNCIPRAIWVAKGLRKKTVKSLSQGKIDLNARCIDLLPIHVIRTPSVKPGVSSFGFHSPLPAERIGQQYGVVVVLSGTLLIFGREY